MVLITTIHVNREDGDQYTAHLVQSLMLISIVIHEILPIITNKLKMHEFRHEKEAVKWAIDDPLDQRPSGQPASNGLRLSARRVAPPDQPKCALPVPCAPR